MCYTRYMGTVASRELRNHTRQILKRVEAGEDITITVDGLPVGRIVPISRKSRWLPRDALLRHLALALPDPALLDELAELAPDTTEDLPPL